MAARMAPQFLLGIPAGMLADAVDRRRLVVASSLGGALATALVAGLAASGSLTLVTCVLSAALLGVLDTIRTTASQTYAYDLIRPGRSVHGMAATNLGIQTLGTIGGLAAGYTLERLGWAITLVGAAVALGIGAVAPVIIGAASSAAREARPGTSVVRGLADLLVRNRLVAVLTSGIILAEVLGFSHQVLLPTFARDIFDAGAGGLGELTAARSVGGVFSLIALTRLGAASRDGAVFLGASAVLGVALLGLGSTPWYVLALAVMFVAGAASATLDTMGQAMLQRACDPRDRGAAMGLWVFAIGTAPVGHLSAGAAASAFGVQVTQLVLGWALVVWTAAIALYRPLRTAR